MILINRNKKLSCDFSEEDICRLTSKENSLGRLCCPIILGLPSSLATGQVSAVLTLNMLPCDQSGLSIIKGVPHESFELNFIWGKMRIAAWETALQRVLRDRS